MAMSLSPILMLGLKGLTNDCLQPKQMLVVVIKMAVHCLCQVNLSKIKIVHVFRLHNQWQDPVFYQRGVPAPDLSLLLP